MQNLTQKLRQSSIVFEKPGICLENLKLWQTLATIEINNSCWNFAHISCLPMSTKECLGFFVFYLELELFAKIKKDLVSTHSQKLYLSITQDLNKIKTIPNFFL